MQRQEPRPRYAHQLVYDDTNRVCIISSSMGQFLDIGGCDKGSLFVK